MCFRKIAAQIRKSVTDITWRARRAVKNKIVLVWGGGTFKPTLKGHDSAPNKGLRRGLSEFFPIVVSSEYYTSQRCGALNCSAKVEKLRGEWSKKIKEKYRSLLTGTKEIRGIFKCNECGTIWNRDMSAALSILKIFGYQSRTLSLERPAAYRRSESSCGED